MLFKETYRSAGLLISFENIKQMQKTKGDIFPVCAILDIPTIAIPNALPNILQLSSASVLLQSTTTRDQKKKDLDSRNQAREKVREDRMDCTIEHFKAAHEASTNGKLPANKQWIEAQLKSEATTISGQRNGLEKRPQDRIIDKILEKKGIDVKDSHHLPKEKEFFDGTESITLSPMQLDNMLSTIQFNANGYITRVYTASLFIQLRLAEGWKLLGYETIEKKMNNSPISSVFTEFIPSIKFSAVSFLKNFRRTLGTKPESTYMSLVFLKKIITRVIRGHARLFNNVTPASLLEASDEVKDYILQKFNDNSTMAAAQMRIDLLKTFPNAKDQIPESAIASMITKYSQQRKTGKDIAVDDSVASDVMIARCRQLLMEEQDLLIDVSYKSHFNKFSIEQMRAYLFHRKIEFDQKSSITSLRALGSMTMSKGKQSLIAVPKLIIPGHLEFYENQRIANRVDIDYTYSDFQQNVQFKSPYVHGRVTSATLCTQESTPSLSSPLIEVVQPPTTSSSTSNTVIINGNINGHSHGLSNCKNGRLTSITGNILDLFSRANTLYVY